MSGERADAAAAGARARDRITSGPDFDVPKFRVHLFPRMVQMMDLIQLKPEAIGRAVDDDRRPQMRATLGLMRTWIDEVEREIEPRKLHAVK
ncbi:MAG: hypothetical protein ACR2OO_05230 [Thermomicrobiales bacterium]